MFLGVTVNVYKFDFYSDTYPNMLADGVIKDCQLSASLSSTGYPAVEARPDSTLGWKSVFRGSPFYHNDYLQINLGNLTRINGMSVYANPEDDTDYVTSFTLQHSLEGVVWYDYIKEGTYDTQVWM